MTPGPSCSLRLEGERRGFVGAVLAREVLAQVAGTLRASGVRVMPLKGVLFQILIDRDPAARRLSDVDVLVPRASFRRSVGALRAAGFAPMGLARSLTQAALLSPQGLTLDLHAALFSGLRYRLSTGAVFARARLDSRLLGVPLWLPHAHDVLGHLIGKWVADHPPTRAASENLRRAADLCAAWRHFRPDAREFAASLEAHGLARAARWVLPRASALSQESELLAPLDWLSPDPLGQALVRAFARSLGGPARPLPAHLLNANLARSLSALGVSALARGVHSASQRLPQAWLGPFGRSRPPSSPKGSRPFWTH